MSITKQSIIKMAGLAILAAAGLIVWFQPPAPAPVPMPSTNGYDDFVKAGRLLVNNQPGWWDLDHEKLRDYVLPNAEALKLVRVGLGRQCRVPIEYSMAHYWVLNNNRMSFKSLMQALTAEGTLAEMEHRTNEAAIAFFDIVRSGHELSRGGVLLDGMFAIVYEKIGLSRLQQLTAGVDGPTCRDLIKTLEYLETRREPPEEFLRRDKEYERRIFSVKERVEEMIESRSFDSTAGVRVNFVKLSIERQQQSGLLLLDLAARAFELENGRRPQSAKELVPDYLRAVPKDPITGAELALPK